MIGKKIADGRTAEVYEWNDDKVIKLYRNGWRKDTGKYEYKINQALYNAGLKVPFSYQLIKVNNRFGLIYEKIVGESMLSLMQKDFSNIKEYALDFAKIHASLADKEIDFLPSYKSYLKRAISKNHVLYKQAKVKINKILGSLPDDNKVCHGDFHPGNIIINQNEFVVIDWINALKGNPSADAAKTYVLIKAAQSPDPELNEKFNILKELIIKNYLDEYTKIRNIDFADIEKWILPVAAARISENIPEEKENLLKIIKDESSKMGLDLNI